MNNAITIILSSAVISSLITTIFSYVQSNNRNQVEFIAKHRTETDNSKLLRAIIPRIYDSKNKEQLEKIIIK